MSSLHHILRLRQALETAKCGGVPGDADAFAFTTNRGHKLEPGARFVSSRTLNVPETLNELEQGLEHDCDGSGSGGEEPELEPIAGAFEAEEAEELKESLHINAAEILQPISSPAELCTHPAMRAIFTSPFLRQISREMLDTIVEEKHTLERISDLYMALLGDDDRLVLPQIQTALQEREPGAADPADVLARAEAGRPLPPYTVTPDWFFAIPEPRVDRNLGLAPAEADALRQKLLTAQHLMMEYVNSLEEIRGGLVKTQRLRQDVLGWCRELNNEDYVKVGLDAQNNNDNAGLGERPAKDFAHEMYE